MFSQKLADRTALNAFPIDSAAVSVIWDQQEVRSDLTVSENKMTIHGIVLCCVSSVALFVKRV